MRVLPLAHAAATARIGYSSIMRGARSAGTSMARSGPASITRSATGSPPGSERGSMRMRAPIS